MNALLPAFARHLGLPPEAAQPALDTLLNALRETLGAEGAGTLDGVGRFYRTSEALAFAPDPALLAAVNAPFAGLPTVTPAVPAPPPAADEAPVDEEEPEPEAAAEEASEEAPEAQAPEPEEETAAQLFSVPLEPAEPVEDDDELAAPILDVPPPPPPPPRTSDSSETPIAPVPSAPRVASAEPPEEPEEEDAFATASEAPPPEPAPALPLRDLSSEEEAEPLDEPGAEEAEPLEAPIAVPFVPADSLPRSSGDLDEAEEPSEDEEEAYGEPYEEGGDTLEADLEALLAGVWAPSTPPRLDHPLGPSSEPDIEDAEYDLVGGQAEPELPEPELPEEESAEEPSPIAPVEEVPRALAEPPVSEAKREVFELRARTPFVPSEEEEPPPAEPPPVPPRLRRPVPPAGPTERRSRGLALWLPLLLLAVAALALFLLWPRSGVRQTDGGLTTPNTSSPPVAALPDTAEPAGVSADTAIAATPPADTAEEAATATPSPETPPSEEAPPPRPQPQPTPAAPEPETAAGGIPAPLRGPGGVDPARGGATWVLGSGSRTGAERDVAHYRRLGYRADVLTGTARGQTVHRVVVGQFSSFEEALRYRSALPPGAPASAWVLRL